MLEALALATAVAPFNPPLGVPLAYVSREDRVIGGRTLHFESHRRITFTRERGGFLVTIRFEDRYTIKQGKEVWVPKPGTVLEWFDVFCRKGVAAAAAARQLDVP